MSERRLKTGEEIWAERFANITDLAVQVYKGARVLFHVGHRDSRLAPITAEIVMHQHCDAVFVHPEDHMSAIDRREFIHTLVEFGTFKGKRVLIVTDDATILSDAFACQICLDAGTLEERTMPFATFGADPGRIERCFTGRANIGALAEKTLREFLARNDWTEPELRKVVDQIGGGRPRARLREEYDKLFGGDDGR